MNKSLVAFFAALEAFLTVAVGVGVILIPLSIMWLFSLGSGIGWDVYWRAAVDVWFLGHGVDLTITLSAAQVAALALPGAEVPFVLSIAPLAIALITVLMGVRVGRKTVEAGNSLLAPLAAIATFAGLTVVIALTAIHPSAMPTLWMAFIFPSVIFALSVVVGARGEIGRSGGQAERVQQRVRGWALRIPEHISAAVKSGITLGLTSTVLVLACSALLMTTLLVVNFAPVLRLFESLQGGVGGGLILTGGQLLFIPNFVIWAASWLIGPGFAIGVGSSVSPVGTQLGPIPSLPILGILPQGSLAWGFVGLLVPLLTAFIAAIVIKRKTVWVWGGTFSGGMTLLTMGVSAVTAGIVMALLAWFSSGAAGPGRLIHVGPIPWSVGLIYALEVLVAASVGWLAGGKATTKSGR